MKEFLSIIQSELTARMKTPLVGTLFFSLIITNYKSLAIFFLSDDKQKLKLILEASPDFTGLLLNTISVALMYILFSQFIAPYIQGGIEKLKLYAIDMRRYEHRSKRLQADYEERANSNLELVKSDVDYLREVATKELTTWEDDRKQLDAEVASLKQKLDQVQASLSTKSQEVQKLTIQIDNNFEYKKRYEDFIANLSQHNYQHYADLKALVKSISDDKDLTNAIQMFDEINQNSNPPSKVFNMPAGDEISFLRMRDGLRDILAKIAKIQSEQDSQSNEVKLSSVS